MKHLFTLLIFILSFLVLKSQNDLSTRDVAISIHDIQYTEDESGDSPQKNNIVTTQGVVTAVKGKNYWIQDGNGEWNGLFVYNNSENNIPSIGDLVKIKGKIIEYHNLTEMTEVSEYTVLSSSSPLPSPSDIGISEAKSEKYESVFVKLKGVCTNLDAGFNMWTIIGESGDIKVHNKIYTHQPELNKIYEITGIIDYAYSEYRILPRSESDIVELETSTDPLISIVSPINNSIIYENSLEVTFIYSNFNFATDGKVEWQLDMGEKNYSTSSPILLTNLSEGTHSLELRLVDNDNSAIDLATAKSSISFEINLAEPEFTKIYDIQYSEGPNYDSPLKNANVWVKGIVTASFNNVEYLDGYFLQDGLGEWNSIYVLDKINSPNIGDSVSIKAKVKENYKMTCLQNIESYKIIDIDGIIAAPSTVTIPQANSEQFESCLVKVSNIKCINPSAPYGNIIFSDGTNTLICKNNKSISFQPVKDESYDIIGVIIYAYNEFSLIPRLESDFSAPNNINNEYLDNQIYFYPNPANTHISISSPWTEGQIIIYNTIGQEIIKENINSTLQDINISQLKSGSYILKIINNKESTERKLIIE